MSTDTIKPSFDQLPVLDLSDEFCFSDLYTNDIFPATRDVFSTLNKDNDPWAFAYTSSLDSPEVSSSRGDFDNVHVPAEHKSTTKLLISGAIASNAFRLSSMARPWVFEAVESLSRAHDKLTLPKTIQKDGTFRPIANSSLHLPLSFEMRDRILAVINSNCPLEKLNWAKSTSGSFPSTETLSALLQQYTADRGSFSMTEFIHLPSMNISEAPPELISMMIVKGAAEAPSPAIRKFCNALQQVMKNSLVQHIIQNINCVKDLWFGQTHLLQQFVGYFSGSRMQVEGSKATVSRSGMIVTQMKTISMLKQDPRDSGSEEMQVNLLWSQWCEQESVNRLIYFAWITETQGSMAHDTNIILSYEDMDTPLPASDTLWTAVSAGQWQHNAVQLGQWKNELSLYNLMQDPSLLVSHQNKIDVSFAQLALVSGAWILVREFRQISSLQQGGNTFNSAILDSRRDELATFLGRLLQEFQRVKSMSCQVEMLCHFVTMHLYAPYRDIEVFAGRESRGRQGSSQAEFVVRQWAQYSGSRMSIYHAGQVIRVAESFSSHSLCDVYTVALFHAALVLWAYGILLSTCGYLFDNFSAFETGPTQTILNGSPTEVLNGFPRSGGSRVGLRARDGHFLSLDKPAAVIEFVVSTLKDNWTGRAHHSINEEYLRLLNGIYSATLDFESS